MKNYFVTAIIACAVTVSVPQRRHDAGSRRAPIKTCENCFVDLST
jgi:hypothetical protein